MRHVRTHHGRTEDDVQARHATNRAHLSLSEDQIRAIYQFMYRHVGNRGDAESLTECACSEALRAARDLADENDAHSLGELLWQRAHEVAAEHLRWFYGSPVAPAGEAAGDDYMGAGAQVREILAHLPAQERDFLSHRFLANASLDEVAAALGMTRSDAQTLQWRALLQAARIRQPETTCSTC